MSASEVLINFGISVFSGIISGVLVTIYYRFRDLQDRWKRQLQDDKQNMSQFLNVVANELQFLHAYPERDTDYLLRLLPTVPKFLSYSDLRKIKPEHQNFTSDVYKLMDELEEYLLSGQVNPNKLLQFKARVRQAQFNILIINMGKPQNESLK